MELKHSGHLGDIIYSIPAIKALIKKLKATGCSLYIPIDSSLPLPPIEMKHPGGKKFLGENLYEYIQPLLDAQDIFLSTKYEYEKHIPPSAINLDAIRNCGVNLSAGTIPHYYSKLFGLIIDIENPWLSNIPPNRESRKYIVIGRSFRYLNTKINYEAIKDFEYPLMFIGLPNEYKAFCKDFPSIKIDFTQTKTALEAASYIQGSLVYIGNQSFLFSIAEGLKHPRFLETYEPVPNVIPVGGYCGQFLHTRGLSSLLETLLSRAAGSAEDVPGGRYQLFRP